MLFIYIFKACIFCVYVRIPQYTHVAIYNINSDNCNIWILFVAVTVDSNISYHLGGWLDFLWHKQMKNITLQNTNEIKYL